MALTRIPVSGRVRPAALWRLALRRMAGAAILVISLSVLHELVRAGAPPAAPTAATAAGSCTG